MPLRREIIVTGGAGGIGLAIARRFEENGDAVTVWDSNADALEALGKRSMRLRGVHCDVSQWDSVVDAMAQTVGSEESLDVLVSNVGIGGPLTPLEGYDDGTWEQILRTNLLGMYHVARAGLPHLKLARRGTMILTSSNAGRFGYGRRTAYAASKWGVVGLTKSLSIELGEFGINVNALAPGAVDGPRLRSLYARMAESSGMAEESIVEAALANQSIHRLVTPEDVAGVALFLASDDARMITGQVIAIDGGAKAVE